MTTAEVETLSLQQVIPLVKKLSPTDQTKLLEIVSADIREYVATIVPASPTVDPATAEAERKARVHALMGKYRNSLSSVDEFLRMKHEDNEREDGRSFRGKFLQ